MPSTEDHSIVVRLWVEADDPRPRARLLHLPSGSVSSAAGVPAIVDAFEALLRQCLDRGDATSV